MWPFTRKKLEPVVQEPVKPAGVMALLDKITPEENPNSCVQGENLFNSAVKRTLIPTESGAAGAVTGMDKAEKEAKDSHDKVFTYDNSGQLGVGDMVTSWYSAQGFMGYQLMASLQQNWLVSKACSMPAEDAVRKGWELTLNDGKDLSPKQKDEIRALDKKYKIKENLIEYINFGRVFGVRCAIFLIDGIDYEKPFNINSVKPGSFTGISQVDPYWITPELSMEASSDTLNIDYYVPTWWRVSGMRIHKSHIMTFIPNPVADVLKPTYFFGGVSTVQQIYERVYSAERCADEVPQLIFTKRTNVMFADMEEVMANCEKVEKKLSMWAWIKDNFGIKLLGEEERYEQYDTSLSDLSANVTDQYKLVASAAGVPASKLLESSVDSAALSSDGSYMSENYREDLESIQSDHLTPFLDRYYQLLIKSEKDMDLDGANLTVKWNELDALTEEQRANVNLTNSQTDLNLRNAGGIDGEMIYNRVVGDPNSGYEAVEEYDLLETVSEPEIENETTLIE